MIDARCIWLSAYTSENITHETVGTSPDSTSRLCLRLTLSKTIEECICIQAIISDQLCYWCDRVLGGLLLTSQMVDNRIGNCFSPG